MKYLAAAPQASVPILFPVCRWLADQDGAQAALSAMNDALRPEPLTSGETALPAALRVAQDIDLLQKVGSDRTRDEDTIWRLGLRALSQREAWYGAPSAFRALVRRMLLQKAVNDIESGAVPSDVAIGLAWLLAQDVARPIPAIFREFAEPALVSQKLDGHVNGAAQWRPLLRWAAALGCATPTPQSARRALILPDPTAALAEELPALPAEGLPAREFCEAVASSLPILDGGRVAEHMRKMRAECADPREDSMVGPAFALALRRLDAQGRLVLKTESDATHRVDCILHGERWTFDRVMPGEVPS